ncbi:unnamed protein product [Rotaria socialis]|uniref:Uncharacterized protein n=2 Tax=Rotaria socialis TaxID=392032 RepID=A0A820VPV3_9BILA|nr:unnamed protein product [Rotaria socialis]CAF4505025.1 unnamed protein product [Rotaria socialis]
MKLAGSSSHLQGGTITWRIKDSSTSKKSVRILITQTYSWIYTSGRCDNGQIATNQLVAGSVETLTCSPSSPSSFGIVSAIPYCTDVSSLSGVAIGQGSDIVSLSQVRRPGNDMFNNAPVAAVMFPINIQQNHKTLITVSVSDPDGDIIRCRWANSLNGVDECSSIAASGYAIALMVEDFINSSSTTPLSSAPVQFIVKIITPPSCSILPEVFLTGESYTPVKVNETFISQLLVSLTKLTSLLYYKTLTMAPTIYQLGYQVMCTIALNSQCLQSSQYCFTIYVTENGTTECPRVINNATPVTASTSILSTATAPYQLKYQHACEQYLF